MTSTDINWRVLICRGTPVAPDPRVEKIARSLVSAGCQVRIVAWDMTGEYPLDENLHGATLARVRLKAGTVRGIWNIFHQARWQVVLAVWLARHRREFEIIHACDFDTVLPALLAQALWGKVVIYDIFDFYVDMLRATPVWVKNAIRRLDWWAIERADAVILADESRVQQIQGASPRRCAFVYNCLDDLLAGPQPPLPAQPGSLHLSYVGNLQIERGLLPLLEVLERQPEFSLDLAGFGGDEGPILQAAARLSNVAWHGRVPYEHSLRLNQAADVLIATYDPKILNHRYSSPNKVFESMMLGKPVIVARHTNMDTLIEREECGLVVDYGDIDALESALLRLSQDPALRQRLGENARRAFAQTYNWPHMAERMLSLYQEVAGKCA